MWDWICLATIALLMVAFCVTACSATFRRSIGLSSTWRTADGRELAWQFQQFNSPPEFPATQSVEAVDVAETGP